jgi:hypothetical protein
MMLLTGSGLCSAMKPMIQDAVGTDNPAPRFCWRAVRKKILTAEFASQVFFVPPRVAAQVLATKQFAW